MIAQLLFAVCLAAGVLLFSRRVAFIRRNILMGQHVDRSDRPGDRWKIMTRVALRTVSSCSWKCPRPSPSSRSQSRKQTWPVTEAAGRELEHELPH